MVLTGLFELYFCFVERVERDLWIHICNLLAISNTRSTPTVIQFFCFVFTVCLLST